jgi:hypothetical protein
MAGVYEAALCALSEGCCPRHGGHLALNGWCARCRAWWRIDQYTMAVITEFPDVITGYPVMRPP